MALQQKINEVLQRVNWLGLKQSLNETGNAVIPALLDDRQCQQLAALYQERALFRTRIVMARHGFGRGEYQYFGYPLPTVLESLRHSFYPHRSAHFRASAEAPMTNSQVLHAMRNFIWSCVESFISTGSGLFQRRRPRYRASRYYAFGI